MTRRAVGFFKLTEHDLSDENIDTTAEAILAAILESRAAVDTNSKPDNGADEVKETPSNKRTGPVGVDGLEPPTPSL